MNVGTVDACAPEADRRATAWDRFYAHCFRIINQCPNVRRLSGADRDDCVQDVMMEIVRRFGERRPEDDPEALTGWIRVVSRNKAADIARRRVRRPEVGFDDGTGSAVLDESDEAGPGLDEGESIGLVWEALTALDQEVTMTSYLIFYLRTIENWTIPEIAEVMQITSEQTRFRCHRVRKRFGAILKAKGSDVE